MSANANPFFARAETSGDMAMDIAKQDAVELED